MSLLLQERLSRDSPPFFLLDNLLIELLKIKQKLSEIIEREKRLLESLSSSPFLGQKDNEAWRAVVMEKDAYLRGLKEAYTLFQDSPSLENLDDVVMQDSPVLSMENEQQIPSSIDTTMNNENPNPDPSLNAQVTMSRWTSHDHHQSSNQTQTQQSVPSPSATTIKQLQDKELKGMAMAMVDDQITGACIDETSMDDATKDNIVGHHGDEKSTNKIINNTKKESQASPPHPPAVEQLLESSVNKKEDSAIFYYQPVDPNQHFLDTKKQHFGDELDLCLRDTFPGGPRVENLVQVERYLFAVSLGRGLDHRRLLFGPEMFNTRTFGEWFRCGPKSPIKYKAIVLENGDRSWTLDIIIQELINKNPRFQESTIDMLMSMVYNFEYLEVDNDDEKNPKNEDLMKKESVVNLKLTITDALYLIITQEETVKIKGRTLKVVLFM